MSLSACAEITRKGDPDRFLATMAAPPEARKILFPLYAFNVEVVRAPWVTQEPMIAEMRLQWWRDALAEIGEGGVIRGHEVVTELAHVLPKDMVPVLDMLVAARRWDIYDEPFEGIEAFNAYLTDTGGGLMRAAAHALGAEDDGTAQDIGRIGAFANFLLAVPTLKARGRRPLLAEDAATTADLARQWLKSFKMMRPKGPTRIAALAAWQAPAILARATKEPSAILEGRLALSDFRKRASLLWRAALA